MVKKLLAGPARLGGSVLAAVVDVVLQVGASVWRARAQLLDAAGAVCLVVFAGSFGLRWAFAVAGVYLLVRGGLIEAKVRR